MHVYFSGIGGSGIGPLSLVAHQAGYEVSGSDKQNSSYIENLRSHGITDISIGQSFENIAKIHAQNPIDWYVYSSAVAIEQPDAPELVFCRENNIKMTKRDDFINQILSEKNLKLLAIAGTHGKTTTTAMAIWLFKQLDIPIAYSVGAKLSFGPMGYWNADAKFFVYEADEFDRNFLAFSPELSIITGIDWDHPDIYPTQESYNQAFNQFIAQSSQTIAWQSDVNILGVTESSSVKILDDSENMLNKLSIAGEVNRKDAWQVISAVHQISGLDIEELISHMNKFPGLSRRFEQIIPRLYSDYAHTPPKVRGALQLAHELAGERVVVVYEGLHNTRQHFIKNELRELFDNVKQLYIVPSYLAREDSSLQLWTPEDIKNILSPKSQAHTNASSLNETLKTNIQNHLESGDLIVCLSAGGGESLDEWLRKEFL